MTETESPGALAALGASVADQLGRQVTAESNLQRHERQLPQASGAAVTGPDRCEAGVARTYPPAFALNRNLIAAGVDPVAQTVGRLDQSNLSTDENVRRGQHAWARVRDLSVSEFLRRQPPNPADVMSLPADMRRSVALEIGERQ
jgi:hypothetical protein